MMRKDRYVKVYLGSWQDRVLRKHIFWTRDSAKAVNSRYTWGVAMDSKGYYFTLSLLGILNGWFGIMMMYKLRSK